MGRTPLHVLPPLPKPPQQPWVKADVKCQPHFLEPCQSACSTMSETSLLIPAEEDLQLAASCSGRERERTSLAETHQDLSSHGLSEANPLRPVSRPCWVPRYYGPVLQAMGPVWHTLSTSQVSEEITNPGEVTVKRSS